MEVTPLKPELLILSGLPASGKSTLSKTWVADDPDARIRVNYDDMRIQRYGLNWKFNRKEEDEMQAAARANVVRALSAGISVVIDNTNLSERVRNSWKQLGKQLGANVVEQEMETSVAECVRRDLLRVDRAGGRVGRAVIEMMALRYGFLSFTESARPIAVFDIDGTVANCQHRLHHIKPTDGSKKNWPAFNAEAIKDEPILEMIRLVRLLSQTHDIIFLSGRDVSIGISTEGWLDQHLDGREDIGRPDVSIYKHLFLRQSGDSRKDFEYKLEILSYIPQSRVEFIFEDRDQCVRAFRDEGYRVLQVADGGF